MFGVNFVTIMFVVWAIELMVYQKEYVRYVKGTFLENGLFIKSKRILKHVFHSRFLKNHFRN